MGKNSPQARIASLLKKYFLTSIIMRLYNPCSVFTVLPEQSWWWKSRISITSRIAAHWSCSPRLTQAVNESIKHTHLFR